VEWKQQHDHGHPQTSLELYGIRGGPIQLSNQRVPTTADGRVPPPLITIVPTGRRARPSSGPTEQRPTRAPPRPCRRILGTAGSYFYSFIFYCVCPLTRGRVRRLPPSRSPLEPPLHGGQPRVHHHRRLTYRRFCTQAPVAGTATRWPLATAAGSRTGAGGTRRLRGSSRGSSSSL
jgi:hypothetical protein